MLLVSMSPKKEDSISWARPSCFFRAFLSIGIWLPLANLSYSIYLWHFFIMLILLQSNESFAGKKKAMSHLSV
jgi:peptidoglycan/LPS O-acetylase OafA/YrhL